jgi:ribosomal protein L20
MAALRKLSVALNRKMLSELAIYDQAAFDKLVAMVSKQ